MSSLFKHYFYIQIKKYFHFNENWKYLTEKKITCFKI